LGTNRIKRFERVWAAGPSTSTKPPDGFVLMSLGHLTPAQAAALHAQRSIYQWAYDEARKAAEERFIHDWVI
jgi:hypothetical protein